MDFQFYNVALTLLLSFTFHVAQAQPAPPSSEKTGTDGYVGSTSCVECHETQYTLWQGSNHDLAMQEANERTVLGDFSGATYDHFGTISTFVVRDGQYFVRTDGPDGALHEYPIAYTFGVFPLQQYLITFPGGRLQALDIAWDSRPEAEGGKRWFHLHPQSPVPHGDVLHWTGPNLNWNYMCAACHSTNLKINYDEQGDGYRTTWAQINVGCEACHGPGEKHIDWARAKAKEEADSKVPSQYDSSSDKSLSVLFRERVGVSWVLDPKTGKPQRSRPRTTKIEIETCAPCHSRRSQLQEAPRPGRPLMDAFLPALLTEGLYFADGQMQDEVYVYGSFLQSRMAQAGVNCSDCHDPHSGTLRLPGSEVCAQCHDANRYAARAHHFHEPGTAGASCIECHMPATTYMGVDQRNDHSFRIPRPDLTLTLGTPNACNRCHSSYTAAWANEAVKKWYGNPLGGFQRFAPALSAARRQQPEAKQLLRALIEDNEQPAIARATGLRELSGYLDRETLPLIARGLQDDDPMVRVAALTALAPLDSAVSWPLASPLLDDDRLAVRIEAGRLLAPALTTELSPEETKKLRRAVDEYIAAQRVSAERPEAQVNLGTLFSFLREFGKAEIHYRRALELQPDFIPAYVNLSDLLSRLERESEGEALLRVGLARQPEVASLHYALGLSLIRQKRLSEGLPHLARANALEPDNARFGYVYAVALQSTHELDKALEVLEATHERAPGNIEVLQALVAYNRDAGRLMTARKYAENLSTLTKGDPALARLIQELDSAIESGVGRR